MLGHNIVFIFIAVPRVQEKVKIEAKIPEKKIKVDNMIDTAICMLTCMVNRIHKMTSDKDVELLYEIVEEFICQNRQEKIASCSIIKELQQKIAIYAFGKKDEIPILARFVRFTLMIQRTYGADLVSSLGSLRLDLTFSTTEGYELYMHDFNRGKIEKHIHSLLFYPPYQAHFKLNAEDLTMNVNDTHFGKLSMTLEQTNIIHYKIILFTP
jgi:hypothetical protein